MGTRRSLFPDEMVEAWRLPLAFIYTAAVTVRSVVPTTCDSKRQIAALLSDLHYNYERWRVRSQACSGQTTMSSGRKNLRVIHYRSKQRIWQRTWWKCDSRPMSFLRRNRHWYEEYIWSRWHCNAEVNMRGTLVPLSYMPGRILKRHEKPNFRSVSSPPEIKIGISLETMKFIIYYDMMPESRNSGARAEVHC
jgi:hypothetical protein